jgi:hypothetical protein
VGFVAWSAEVTASPRKRLRPAEKVAANRGHWSIESVPYIIDWNYLELR